MLPVLIGLVSAMAFGILSHSIYGTSGIMNHAWIDTVFWALIGTGVAVSAMNMIGECLPCRVSRLLRVRKAADALCKKTPCAN